MQKGDPRREQSPLPARVVAQGEQVVLHAVAAHVLQVRRAAVTILKLLLALLKDSKVKGTGHDRFKIYLHTGGPHAQPRADRPEGAFAPGANSWLWGWGASAPRTGLLGPQLWECGSRGEQGHSGPEGRSPSDSFDGSVILYSSGGCCFHLPLR